MGFELRETECRVETLWAAAEDPILVCVLRIEHSLTKACEEVDVVIAGAGATVRHRAVNTVVSSDQESVVRYAGDAEDLASRLRSLGVFDLGSVEQKMFDGSRAEIAAKETDCTNVFSEHSINTPQAQVREFLLGLASGIEQEDSGCGPADSDCEMTFVVTHPKPGSDDAAG